MSTRSHRLAVGLGLITLAGTVVPRALADDEDGKLRDKKPAVVGPVVTPDPWKAGPRTPIGDGGDSTFPAVNVDLKAWIPLNNFPGFTSGSNGADCWGYTSPSGREYALMGLSWGNGIVEVTDPSNPQILTTIPGSVNVLWRDITVVGQYAYAVSDSQGIGVQVMDLSQIDSGVVTLVRNYSTGGWTTTHTLLSNPDSGYLYACGGNLANGGLKPLSLLSDPTLPTFTGVNWTTSYVHEAQIVSYTSGPYAGREIAFLFRGNSSGGRISIVDVTNKSSLVTMSTATYPGQNYSHQGWLSPDRKYLYHNDEIDGPSQNVPRMLTRVFDVSDLSTPRLISVFTNGLPSVDHNEYARGRYLYQSNYTSGMHIWDLSNPLKPVEVASIDTRPEDNGTGYNGAWGNYEFASGTILISDIERGLFVTRMSLLELTAPASLLPATLTPGQATPVSVGVAGREALVGAVDLMVSVNGAPFVAIPMSDAGGGQYTASLPAANCFEGVRYFFSARTDELAPRTFTWPLGAAGGEYLRASVETSATTVFSDSFETDQGWTVQTTATAGAWTRAVPLYNGGPGAVIGDADGSGRCFVTGNTLNADVDGGSTSLLSPVLDLSAAPEARISYARWFCSLVGNVDSLATEISNNNGATWTPVHTVSPASGGWERMSFRVADYVPPTAQVRVRFTTSDGTATGEPSTTEAGIDAFTVVSPVCASCFANCDSSTIPPVLNVNDFICFQSRFAAGEAYADCDQNSTLNVNDFICFQSAFAAGCP